MSQDNTVLMEGVEIIFRNFRGKATEFNQEGNRNFGVKLPLDVAERMAADNWNVKYLKPRDEDEGEDAAPVPWLPVDCGYNGKGRPPQVFQITERGRTALDVETIEVLDWVDIVNVDLIVRPYPWSNAMGASGIKAYLQSLYITINEDPLARKYGDVPLQSTSGHVSEEDAAA